MNKKLSIFGNGKNSVYKVFLVYFFLLYERGFFFLM